MPRHEGKRCWAALPRGGDLGTARYRAAPMANHQSGGGAKRDRATYMLADSDARELERERPTHCITAARAALAVVRAVLAVGVLCTQQPQHASQL